MESLKTIVSLIKENLAEVESEIALSEQKGFVYARAKNIRKAAQSLKMNAQDLRVTTTELFKNSKKSE